MRPALLCAYQAELVGRLRALLGGELVGVYAGGSVALGGYVPGRSDLDVAAVCRGRLARDQKERIGEALRHEALPCPARLLELVVYRAEAAAVPAAEADFQLDLNTGARVPFRLALDPGQVPGHWYAIDRSILAVHGLALAGPPAGEVFAPVPRLLLLPVLAECVRGYAEGGLDDADDAVLNACRAWRYAVEGAWSTKEEAGRWALGRLGEPALVADALDARSGGGELPRDRVARFLRAVAARLDAYGGGSANATS